MYPWPEKQLLIVVPLFGVGPSPQPANAPFPLRVLLLMLYAQLLVAVAQPRCAVHLRDQHLWQQRWRRQHAVAQLQRRWRPSLFPHLW